MAGTFLSNGMAWLNSQLRGEAGCDFVMVTYRRATDSISIRATLGEKLMRVTDGRGQARTERADLDFVIEAAVLTFGEPASGDKIDVNGDRYEAMPMGGEPCFRPERNGLWYRVHGKYVGAAS
jgi:hypothetical protein